MVPIKLVEEYFLLNFVCSVGTAANAVKKTTSESRFTDY